MMKARRPLGIASFPFVLLRSTILPALLASLLAGCFGEEETESPTGEGLAAAQAASEGEASPTADPAREAATAALPAGLVAPLTDIEAAGAQTQDFSYPYRNGFEPEADTGDTAGPQADWRLDGDWQFAQGESYAGQWHLLARRKNESAAYFKGAASLERFIYIPPDAREPTISFRHQLHLWKNPDRVAVEVAVAEQPENWRILKHLTPDEVTGGYEKLDIGISDYIGKSVRFRLRFDLRGEGDTDRLDGEAEQAGIAEGGPVDGEPSNQKAFTSGSRTEAENALQKADNDSGKDNGDNGKREPSEDRGNGEPPGQVQRDEAQERGNGPDTEARGGQDESPRVDDEVGQGVGRDGTSPGQRDAARDRGNGADEADEAEQPLSDQPGNGQARGQDNRANENENNGRALGHDRQRDKSLYWRIDEFAVADRDSDSDGISDYFERRVGTDPFDADSVPADENKDEIPDVINDLMGEWVGECTYLGGGEYIRVTLSFDAHYLHQHHISAAQPDCAGDWLTVTNGYAYSMGHGTVSIGEEGSALDLLLIHSIVIPKETDAAQGLNRSCSKKDFVALAQNIADGVTCAPAVAYPTGGTVFYDRLRLADGEILLGNQLDQTDESLRAEELSPYRFIKTGL